MFDRILLAVDGSENGMHAAQKAAELARTMKPTEFRIVVAYSTIPMYLGEPNLQFTIDTLKGDAEKVLQETVAEIGDLPMEIHKEILEGDPAEAILKVADTRKSDLIVMGSRGLGRLAGLLLGSTSQKVVSHAKCPVLIVR